MEDELDLDLNENNNEEIITRKDKKIKSLSEKFEMSEKEKADLAKAKEEAEAKANALQKEAEFFKGFNTVSSKYQGATEYQDAIREKVLAGYDIEDATVAILNREGKFTPTAPVEDRQPIGGGSASIGMANNSEKSYGEMNKSELRSALEETIAKGDFKW